jgi:hypothetical protein
LVFKLTQIHFRSVYFFAAISVVVHVLLLLAPTTYNLMLKKNQDDIVQSPGKIKLHSLKTVGEKEAKKTENNIYLKPKASSQPSTNSLSAKQLAPVFNTEQSNQNDKKVSRADDPSRLVRPKAIKALSLNKKSVKSLLQGSANELSAKQFMDALGDSDTMVKLEVPQGVKEDELNKHELVFYSFQKRTALNYVNSFYKKLNEFEMQNPHLKFPLTENKQKMVGRVVYDRQGNIIKINILEWSKVEKLQNFFIEVLKEMTSLPNPPEQILKDDTFTVFYALTVNG